VGKIYISLGYKPRSGRLTVGILAASNLLEMDVIGKSGKCEIFYSFEFLQKKSIEMDNIHYDWHIKDGNRVNKQIPVNYRFQISADQTMFSTSSC
jgi:hypothetical protein